jgi:adenosyl cobinamide kinase/adenosyl cobinamide phosphate guanylyltransferase
MLHFILGKARSGKSVYAEEFLSSIGGSTVYIGTLPNIPFYRETISLHQQRRSPHWGLIELSGNPNLDTSRIYTAMSTYQNVLLDGLAFYITRLLTCFDLDILQCIPPFIEIIHYAATRKGEFVLVDHPLSRQLQTLPRDRLSGLNCLAIRYAHKIVAQKAAKIAFYNNGVLGEMYLKDVLRFDRCGS